MSRMMSSPPMRRGGALLWALLSNFSSSPFFAAEAVLSPSPPLGRRGILDVVPGTKELDARHGRRLSTVGAKPVQMYMIPMVEMDLGYDGGTPKGTFEILATSDHTDNDYVNSLISLAVSVSNIVLWYDHWEDGYEADITNPQQASTRIWGDGNPDNGCIEQAANINANCDSSSDIISAGDAFVLESRTNPLTRGSSTEILYDGRDVIKSSFPIAVTRAAYPDSPGSALAGAVEVFDTKSWGSQFRIPVGTDMGNVGGNTGSFEAVEIHAMAAEDGTVVTLYDAPLPGGSVVTTRTIDAGESTRITDDGTSATSGIDIHVGYYLESDKPIQVDLVVGDIEQPYELRWYALVPFEDWYNDYLTPIHYTSSRNHAIVVFNPGTASITVCHQTDSTTGTACPDSKSVSAGGTRYWSLSSDIGATGHRLFTQSSDDVFYAYAMSDTSGDSYYSDWGHPMIASNKLTSQALIGLGYGCTGNVCDSTGARSFVYVSTMKDATVYVDYDSDGFNEAGDGDRKKAMTMLDGWKVEQDGDLDMTGATIWALDAENNPVKIAVAWGQDTAFSNADHDFSLDMGTVVPPLPELSASKTVTWAPDEGSGSGDLDGDGKFGPGDIIEYTIRITNTGQVNVSPDTFDIIDDYAPVHDQSTYEPNSTFYSDGNGNSMQIADDADPGTPFPLDVAGIKNQYDLPKGGAHQVTFRFKIKDFADLTSDLVENTGKIVHNTPDGTYIDEFETRLPMVFSPSIDINTTVLGGDADVTDCPGDETRSDTAGSAVTYCYEITNTGNVPLTSLTFTNTVFTQAMVEPSLNDVTLQPGESIVVKTPDTIDGDETNEGTIVATPDPSKTFLSSYDDVTDADPAGVVELLTAHPTASPTSAPTAPPTSAPTASGHDITGIDSCKQVCTTLHADTEITQFAFLAHASECLWADVYVSETAVTQDEIDKNKLGTHWTHVCAGYVRGYGEAQHAVMDPATCTPYVAEAGTQLCYFIATQTVTDDELCQGAEDTNDQEVASFSTADAPCAY